MDKERGCRQVITDKQDMHNCKVSSSEEYLQKQIEDYTWIQCDNLDCQKWRKIRTEEGENLGDMKWYCSMNTDSHHNNCSSPEEDYSFFDKLAKRLGYKYVMSHLDEGSLVWAKMTGYCKWPAIVCKDPGMEQYYVVDEEGHPWEYHVEYLGNKHSHGWVNSSMLSLYGHKTDNKLEIHQQKSKCQGEKSRKSRKRIRYSQQVKENKVLKKYRRSPVEEAIEEAESLLSQTLQSRLKNCVFVTASSVKCTTKDSTKTMELRKSKSKEDFCRFCGHCGGTSKTSLHKGKNTETKPVSREVKKDDKKSIDKTRILQELTNNVTQPEAEEEKNEPMQETFNYAQLSFQNTMVDKSKEDKFRIDVEMYKKNERAFDHDLYRFMKRNNQKLKRKPVWQNVPIGLFQLFLAVFERGGYEQVCKKYQWTSVYRELTNCGHGSSGVTARSYYKRNVYPYELYITGQDYEKALPLRKKSTDSDCIPKPIIEEEDKKENIETMSCEMLLSEDSAEVDAILDDLERSTWNIFQLQEEIDKTQKRLGIDVKFHDESPPYKYSPGVQESRNLDFELFSSKPHLTAGGVQVVPEVMFSSSESTSCHSEQLILELKALENEFDTVNEEIATLTNL